MGVVFKTSGDLWTDKLVGLVLVLLVVLMFTGCATVGQTEQPQSMVMDDKKPIKMDKVCDTDLTVGLCAYEITWSDGSVTKHPIKGGGILDPMSKVAVGAAVGLGIANSGDDVTHHEYNENAPPNMVQKNEVIYRDFTRGRYNNYKDK